MFKTITAFSVLKFIVGLSCHRCHFLYFTGVVCRSSPIHSSRDAISRPRCLSEVTPNRVSVIREAKLKRNISTYHWNLPVVCFLELLVRVCQSSLPFCRVIYMKSGKTIYKYTQCLLKIAPHRISGNHFSKIWEGYPPPPILSQTNAKCTLCPATPRQVFHTNLSCLLFVWNLLLKTQLTTLTL